MLVQAILRKTSAEACDCNSARVSRATHLPRMRAATLGLSRPVPRPSAQVQSLPKCSLSWKRMRNSRVNAGLRDSALLPEFA